MQQGMLFHRLEGNAPGVDVEQVIGELREPVDAARFEQAWREVIARHPALRTGFEFENDREPRQVVHPASRVSLRFQYEEFADEHAARRGLENYLATDRREGFATLAPPLLRVALLRGGPEHYWFVTTYHHLLLDARSMTVMFKEALDLHDALVQGRVLELPPARPYRLYIDWLQTLHLPRAENFWREYLLGFSTTTLLPVAHATRDVEPGEGAGELAFRLPDATTLQLRVVARKYDVTLNTLVQAAWAVVLSRYSGEEDVVFGALRACRKIPVEGAQSIVGLFINTGPVRVHANADVALGPWLRELREQWLAMRDYEHAPLMKIQQWSEVPRGRPLFETILSYQEPAWDAALNALGGPWARRSFDIRAQPNYPLALEVLGGAALTVKFIYDRARFSGEAIARVMGHYCVVLEALAADAVETVGALPLLTEPERHEVLVTWNRTGADFPRHLCVHSEIEAHAATAPERIAVTDASNALTFGELNARANRVAHRLRSLGVSRDTLVAVCMERSVEMIVAWLGVLKAGGAFVPLDPTYPSERLAFQIEDSRVRVLLTQHHLRAALPPLPTGVEVLDVPADGSGFTAEPDDDPPLAVGADALAYVIYTSGSTGQPKGVEIEHRSLMNLVTWHWRAYQVTMADRATHLASPAFDAAVWEVWPYLAAGASVHIPDDETRLSPALLWRWMAEKRITLSFMPTPLAEAALNEPWPQDLALRALLTGGDKLQRRPPQNFPCALVNHYGPTESTVVATCAAVSAGGLDTAPTIGRPIANTQAYVLDRHLRPVPVGVAGELFIGGESLARGYLRRPELTAERFVPNPFAAGASRLYRTGDLARWTPTGELEFIGRSDGQVKIRGCRIELGEIEATLQSHPAAHECVVLARPDERAQLQLVAYVLAHPDVAPTTELELIEFLRAKLPWYMVPAAVVLLEAWPLTPNGKIDRNALPNPGERLAGSRVPFAAPGSGIEQAVAKIWADVLGCAEVGLADNFFDLGGHSLLAAQVVSRLNALLQGRVSVRALFDHPTLRAFSREVESHLDANGAVPTALHRVKRRAARNEMELVHPN
jgi:amino acid adenylation domain-containing protein